MSGRGTQPRPPRQPPTVWFTIRGFPFHVPRTPRRFFNEMSGGEALFPLIVLAGLTCVERLDVSAFGVLAPDIRDAFNLSNQGFLTLVALTQLGGLLLAIPLAYYSDRLPRVAIALIGAAIWGVFGFATGLCFSVWALIVVRSGAGIGRAVITPTHNSLMSDYYPPEVRPDVFGFHAIGTATGALIGPVAGGILAHFFGWRLPFFVFAIPTFVFVVLALRLHEPGRGRWERAASGASDAVIGHDEVPPSYAESIRILWQVGTLRRIWYSLPFLAASFLGLVTLTSLYYEEIFNLGDAQRGIVAAASEPAQIIAILLGIPLAARLMLRDPGLGLRMLAVVGTAIAGFWVVFALAPNLGLAIAMNILVSGLSSLLVPGIFAALSLSIPPKVRAMGFAMAALFIVPGLLALYVVGGIADAYGIRAGLLIVAPIFLIGAWILASGSMYVKSDINRVWTSTAAQAEVAFKRKQGEVKLLLVRNVDVHYDGVQVLFGVNFEVDEGEIVALLGTNGAGKSTLLKTISGLVEATNGAVVFDGRDMTYAPPNEVAGRGVVQMPGGRGTFPALTVAEHLRLASWLHRKDKVHVREATEHVLDLFPVLRQRLDEPAGNLSGGQQQMLALSMAFIEQPRLLMIDELSLGLAPTIVEQLLPLVRDFAARGTTVILVEQSVNLALTIAETAYFMEKGEIRFHGPTAELLERPDVLRSVFLEGADTFGSTSDRSVGPTVPATPARVEAPAENGHDERAARSSPRPARHLEAVRRIGRAHRRVADGSVGRDRRHHRAQRRGQDHAVRHHLRLHRGRRGHGPARRGQRRARRHPHVAGQPCAPRAGSLVPGRPALPVAHRGRNRRGVVRASPRGEGPRRRRAAPAVHLRRRGRDEQEGRGAPRAARHHRLPRQARPRAVDRQPAHRRPRVRARAQPVGAAARRAVLRYRTARGRGTRAVAAADPRAHGRDAPRDRARRSVAARGVRPAHRAGSRANRRQWRTR